MENFLNNNIIQHDIDDLDDEDDQHVNFINLINNQPDIPLDVEDMEDYIEDIVELYELQYRERPNESGDPPNVLVIRHLVENQRDFLFDLPDDLNEFQNPDHYNFDYHAVSHYGDMPQYHYGGDDIVIANTVNIKIGKKVKPIKTRYKITQRVSTDYHLRFAKFWEL